MRIINIVDNLSSRNFGVWNSAINTKDQLKRKGIDSELWSFTSPEPGMMLSERPVILDFFGRKSVLRMIADGTLRQREDVIVSHGCWSRPTRIGWFLSKRGFKWIYMPHGMLEPWAFRQKSLKKRIYFFLIERPLSKKASIIRSVSSIEADHLKVLYPRSTIAVIGNGVDLQNYSAQKKIFPIQYLFLSRLHKKKGVCELVEGWLSSNLNNDPRYELVLAGPDHGELNKIKNLLKHCTNVRLVGPVYSEIKRKLLIESSFYVLPSYSEGFPTSVLEAMMFQQVCLISKACNFPEAFQNEIAFEVGPDAKIIATQLERAAHLGDSDRKEMAERAYRFVIENFSLDRIAELQINLINAVLAS